MCDATRLRLSEIEADDMGVGGDIAETRFDAGCPRERGVADQKWPTRSQVRSSSSPELGVLKNVILKLSMRGF